MSAWIEIFTGGIKEVMTIVALYMSAWIEIAEMNNEYVITTVALYMSAWIEILEVQERLNKMYSRTLHECVD